MPQMCLYLVASFQENNNCYIIFIWFKTRKKKNKKYICMYGSLYNFELFFLGEVLRSLIRKINLRKSQKKKEKGLFVLTSSNYYIQITRDVINNEREFLPATELRNQKKRASFSFVVISLMQRV